MLYVHHISCDVKKKGHLRITVQYKQQFEISENLFRTALKSKMENCTKLDPLT